MMIRKIVYKISSRLCSANLEGGSGPRTEGVPKQQDMTGNRTLSPLTMPTTLLVRVQCFRKGMYKAVEGPNTRPI